jgi:hypothetical protein
MFKILGADGREYGPVTADQIKKWVIEGRANRDTQAQQTGDSNWKPLAQFADFADVLGVVPPVVAPPPAAPAPIASLAGGPDAGAHARAKEAVSGPAIGLMVTAGLGVAASLVGLVLTLARWGAAPDMPGMDPQMARMIQAFAYGPVGVVTKIVGLALSFFVFYGAMKMQKLAGYGFALAAAIVAMIPCFSPCCLIGLPIGIWALVVLNKPEVKSQFE